MLSFFSFIILSYAAANIYLVARAASALSGCVVVRPLICGAIAVAAVSFPASRLLDSVLSEFLSRAISVLGMVWLAPMVYAVLFTLSCDIYRIAAARIAGPEAKMLLSAPKTVILVFSLTALCTILGVINAKTPIIVRHDIDISSDSSRASEIDAVVMSDIHIGETVSLSHLKKLLKLAQDISPDIVLLPGDIIDSTEWADDPAVLSRARKIFRMVTPRFGIWAVYGNHEYYAGIDRCSEIMKELGISLLRDEWSCAGNEILIVGRDDRTVQKMSDAHSRKTLAEITSSEQFESLRRGKRLPVIVMDHQPFGLSDASSFGAAIQVSGHTHRGQLKPLDMIVNSIYECAYGIYKKEDTVFYISSGAGTWGPPVRTSGRPEVVHLKIRYDRPLS